MKKLLVSSLCLLSLNSVANVAGVYDVKRGFAETLSINQTEQLGEYKIILKDANNNKLKIRGSLRGILDPSTQTLSHTLINTERTGTLITQGDSVTSIYSGDPICANGATNFQIEETLNIVAGTGIYSNVQPGSYIIVDGTINNCPSSRDFLQNDFIVKGGVITFK